MFGDPETMPGGEAQKFLSSLRVRLSAKNVIDKATGILVFKETKVVVKKAKVPVRTTSFEFSLCVHAHDDLKVGETDSFNTVKSHLQALGMLVKTSKGYALTQNGKTQNYSTLTAMQDRYLKDAVFKMFLQSMVIEAYRDKMVLVEETNYSPNDVEPGTPVEVQSVAEE
jgi:RecA/RadA recombinase